MKDYAINRGRQQLFHIVEGMQLTQLRNWRWTIYKGQTQGKIEKVSTKLHKIPVKNEVIRQTIVNIFNLLKNVNSKYRCLYGLFYKMVGKKASIKEISLNVYISYL